MEIWAIGGSERTNVIQSQFEAKCQPAAGNPEHQILNPKKDGWMRNVRAWFEKTKPICGMQK
jgi:hypothetical protein